MVSPTGRVAFTRSLPVEVLMKSAPAIMQTRLARATLVRVASSPVARMVFRWALPGRLAEGPDLVVQVAPAAAQDVLAADDDVDLGRARGHRRADLVQPLPERGLPRREARGDRRHRHPGTRRAPPQR